MITVKSRFLLCVIMVTAVVMWVVPAFAQTTAPNAEAEKRVTLHFKDVPTANAIDILFEGMNHVNEPGISGAVNLHLNDVPFTDALQALLKAAGLTARKENNTYYIGPQKELTADQTQIPQLVPETELQVERAKIPEKIPIGYADVADIGAILGVQSIASRASSMFGGGGMGGMGMGGMGMGGMGMGGMGMGGMGMGGGSGGMSGGMGMGGMSGGYGGMGGGGMSGGYGGSRW
jgi:hypothetical protein